MKVFGKANEFYRARILHLSSQGVENLDWSETILFQEPKRYKVTPESKFKIELLKIDDAEPVAEMIFDSEETAKEKLQQINEDIEELTKNEFDDKYISN